MKQAVKNFSLWRTQVTDPAVIAELDTFVKLAAVKGVHHMDILAGMVKNYNAHFKSEMALHGVKLVWEHELLCMLAGTPLEISHGRLMNWKRAGVFKLGRAESYPCYDNGFRVVYNLEQAKRCIRNRLKALGGKR